MNVSIAEKCDGSQGPRKNVNPSESPTLKRPSRGYYEHGSEDMEDLITGTKKNKKPKLPSDYSLQRDSFTVGNADHSKDDSTINLVLVDQDTSSENTTDEIDQVSSLNGQSVLASGELKSNFSSALAPVEEMEGQSKGAQIGDVGSMPFEHSHTKRDHPDEYDLNEPTNNFSTAPESVAGSERPPVVNWSEIVDGVVRDNIGSNAEEILQPEIDQLNHPITVLPECIDSKLFESANVSSTTKGCDSTTQSYEDQVDHVSEEPNVQGEEDFSNSLSEMTRGGTMSEPLALSASKINMKSSTRLQVGNSNKFNVTPFSNESLPSNEPGTIPSEQPTQSHITVQDGTTPQRPQALLSPSKVAKIFDNPVQVETSNSKDALALTAKTDSSNDLFNVNAPDELKQQTSSKDQLPSGVHLEQSPDQSSSLIQIDTESDDLFQSNNSEVIILSDAVNENLCKGIPQMQTNFEDILPYEPPRTLFTLKEAVSRLATCAVPIQDQNSKMNHSIETTDDVQAGIQLRNLLEKRADGTITSHELKEAIMQGIPTPPRVFKIKADVNRNPSKQDQQTNEGVVKKMAWITGSFLLERYYCWPCLLFSTKIWEISVTRELDDIFEAAKIHQVTMPHMSACIQLQVQESTLRHEQKTKLEAERETRIRHELLLKRLIEITSTDDNTGTTEEFIELMDLVCSNNVDVKEFLLKKSAVTPNNNYLAHVVGSNIPVILEATEQLLQEKIVEEIKKVPFVTVIFEDITNVVDKSSVAIILRYSSDFGVPIERIVKIIQMGSSRTVADLLKTMTSLVQEYNLKEKLVGFTYSGTVISANEVLIFNKTVTRLYPKARFFPYQEHNFQNIIVQSLSHSSACRHFFYTVNELSEFLKKTPNVKEKLKIDDKSGDQNKLEFVEFITTLQSLYASVTELFDIIVEDASGQDLTVLMKVEYFSLFLKSPYCQIMVMVVSSILEATNQLSTALQNNVDISLWKRSLSEANDNLDKIKTAGLGKTLREHNPLPVAAEYEKLFDQVMETVIFTVNYRLADLEMAFVRPYDRDALSIFQQRVGMDQETFSQLQIEAESLFEEPVLIKSEQALRTYMVYNSNSDNTNRHLLKFLQFSQTIPTKESYSLDSKSAVETLHSYISSNQSVTSLNLLKLTGKDILTRMRQEEVFYDSILEQCLHKADFTTVT